MQVCTSPCASVAYLGEGTNVLYIRFTTCLAQHKGLLFAQGLLRSAPSIYFQLVMNHHLPLRVTKTGQDLLGGVGSYDGSSMYEDQGESMDPKKYTETNPALDAQ